LVTVADDRALLDAGRRSVADRSGLAGLDLRVRAALGGCTGRTGADDVVTRAGVRDPHVHDEADLQDVDGALVRRVGLRLLVDRAGAVGALGVGLAGADLAGRRRVARGGRARGRCALDIALRHVVAAVGNG